MSERTLYEQPETIRGHKYIRLKSNRLITFWNAFDMAGDAQTSMIRAFSRCYKLANSDYDLERLEWFIDNTESWIAAVREEMEKRRGVRTKQERIALLRNTTGRTPEEAAVYKAKADKLERELGT